MFKLEVFRALHGDALLLHYGTRTKPLYALVDAGPKTVWANSVQPGLQELRKRKALPLRWVALSHVDEDHVMGLIDMLTEIKKAMPDPAAATASTAALFHNTPGPAAPQPGVAGGVPGAGPDPADPRAKVEAELKRVATKQTTPIVQVASYRQGADLANLASTLFIARNPPTGGRLLTGDVLASKITKPLKVSVVSPSVTILEKLIKAWEKQLGKDGGIVTASVEKKIQNLSSVVLLVEDGTKKMLLTGDALDFDVIAGLEELDLLAADGTFKVDLLKLPHHGAESNNHEELFACVKARHYVISADGNHGNPDDPTLERLVASEKDRKCTIWMANGPGEDGAFHTVLDKRFAKLAKLIDKHGATRIDVRHPKPDQRSVVVTLAK